MTVAEICKHLGIAKSTFHTYLAEKTNKMKKFSIMNDDFTALLDSLAKAMVITSKDLIVHLEKINDRLDLNLSDMHHTEARTLAIKSLKELILQKAIAIVRKEEYFLDGNTLRISGKFDDLLKYQEWNLIFRGNDLLLESVKFSLKNTYSEEFKSYLPSKIGSVKTIDLSQK